MPYQAGIRDRSYLVIGEVYACFCGTVGDHRVNQKTGSTDKVLVVDSKASGVVGEHHVMWLDDRCTAQTGVEECGVPSGKERVAEADRIT